MLHLGRSSLLALCSPGQVTAVAISAHLNYTSWLKKILSHSLQVVVKRYKWFALGGLESTVELETALASLVLADAV